MPPQDLARSARPGPRAPPPACPRSSSGGPSAGSRSRTESAARRGRAPRSPPSSRMTRQPVPPLLADDVAPDAALLHPEVLERALELLLHHASARSGVAMSWEWVCSSEAPAASPWFLKTRTYSKRGSFARSQDPLAVGAEHLGECAVGRRSIDGVVVGRLDDDLVGPHPVHPVVEPLARGSSSPSIRSAGNLFGTTRTSQPGRFGGLPSGRSAQTSSGVRASCPAQKTHGPPFGWPARRREVRGPARALGRDDHPAAHDGVLPQLRHAPPASSSGRGSRASSEAERLRERLAVEEHRRDLLADRHRSRRAPRASRSAEADGAHALGDHGRGPPRASASAPAARERQAERAVPAQRARARQDEVAEPGEPREASRAAPPSATPSRVISARPRVISAARAFSPSPSPSTARWRCAITFFSAPPSSTPEHVAVRVEPERAAPRALAGARRATPLVRGRDDERGRLAQRHLARERRAGEHRDRPARAAARARSSRHADARARGSRPFVADTQHRAVGAIAAAIGREHAATK